jgi:aspartate racemase
MKTIGLVGGTGWISTSDYYRIINEEVNRRLGGLEFARCIVFSLNYGDINEFNKVNNREGVFSLIADASIKLAASGADCILLCANTLHQFVEKLETRIDVPIIHIASATAKEIAKSNISRIGLLGTRQTMEMDFYRSKLIEENIETLIPEPDDRNFIQWTIDNELLKGIISEASKNRFVNICRGLGQKGARGIVLGCTEIPLLVRQEHLELPLFNTTVIHSLAAVDFALGGN